MEEVCSCVRRRLWRITDCTRTSVGLECIFCVYWYESHKITESNKLSLLWLSVERWVLLSIGKKDCYGPKQSCTVHCSLKFKTVVWAVTNTATRVPLTEGGQNGDCARLIARSAVSAQHHLIPYYRLKRSWLIPIWISGAFHKRRVITANRALAPPQFRVSYIYFDHFWPKMFWDPHQYFRRFSHGVSNHYNSQLQP
jgi:hypothetical protein